MASSADKRADELRQAMEAMVGVLDRQHLRPLQKDSYLCMSRCCDSAGPPAELKQCCNDCERKVVVAEQTVQVGLADFQEKLQRCVQRCQDQAQEMLPSKPSDKDISKAQDKLANCAADCAQEFARKIPKLQATIIERLKQLK